MSHLLLKTVFGVVAGVAAIAHEIKSTNDNYREIREVTKEMGYEYKGSRYLSLGECGSYIVDAKDPATGQMVHATVYENGIGSINAEKMHFTASKP